MYLIWWHVRTIVETVFWPISYIIDLCRGGTAMIDEPAATWRFKYLLLKSIIGIFILIASVEFCLSNVPLSAVPNWIRVSLIASWVFYVASARKYYDSEVKLFA